MLIRTKLVRDGIGLPPVWQGRTSEGLTAKWVTPVSPSLPGWVCLADLQTEYGLAQKLREWGGGKPTRNPFPPEPGETEDGIFGWRIGLCYLEFPIPGSWDFPKASHAMGHVIEYIGMDHAVRRALGWEVTPGTLTQLELDTDGEPVWTLSFQGDEYVIAEHFSAGMELTRQVEGIDSVTNPEEAMNLIYKAVCL